MGVVMIGSRPLIGYLIDRLPLRLTLAIMLMGPIVGIAGLLFARGVAAAMFAAAGLGLAVGSEFVALGYVVSRGFPVTNFGVMYCWLGIAGTVLISWIAASKQGYSGALLATFVIIVAALPLGMTLPDRRFRTTESHQSDGSAPIPPTR